MEAFIVVYKTKLLFNPFSELGHLKTCFDLFALFFFFCLLINLIDTSLNIQPPKKVFIQKFIFTIHFNLKFLFRWTRSWMIFFFFCEWHVVYRKSSKHNLKSIFFIELTFIWSPEYTHIPSEGRYSITLLYTYLSVLM